ncbi:MAG: lipoate--protein ligase [Candidatus Faecousia sp.]|nr:lipoate--protein ligase [Candidatus Faecousia sp.]
MIERIALYESASYDPYYNLAVEQYLLENVEENTCILYLWQNQHTVVIGRNQNAWKECRTTLLEQEGGHLARRLSGGGAVFHDLGNLNFTFLVPQADYDLDRQFSVIQEAARSFGIPAEKSGRNDVLAEGRKFSGNAFYRNGTQAYHHGTLLVDVDMQNMGRYLNPSKAKLKSKGVDSVRSRVVNLKELNPDITISSLKAAMAEAFAHVYALSLGRISDDALDADRIDSLRRRNGSWDWLYGQKIPFTLEWEDRFAWGGVQIAMQVEQGVVQQAKVYSDAMDWSMAPKLEQTLTGCRFTRDALREAIASADTGVAEDLSGLLELV